ncbi:MAG: hypothetical protein NVS1B13_13930 [Flavisolibacter sp.]
MAKFYPYIINHVRLDQSFPPSYKSQDPQGAYMVYWWKAVPLGHLFIGPGLDLSPIAYENLVGDCIEPTIEFYKKKFGFVPALPMDKGWDNLKKIMEAVFETPAPVTSKVTDISIVICTRNRASQLVQCLHSLESLYPKPKEIIVVDNAPSDQSTNQAAMGKSVIYVLEPRPGLDIARNTGIKRASGQIVAFMDDDISAEPNCLAEIEKTFEDLDIEAMTGLVLAAELNTEAQFVFEKEWSFNRGYIDKVFDRNYFERTLSVGPPVWEIGAGANMAFRRHIFNFTGYFDERLDVGAAGCNGDSEMWFRILSKGYSIAYNPRAVVHHQHRKTLSGLKKQLFYYMKGFTVAALIQQKQQKNAGYKRQVFKILPLWYLKLLVRGFPTYASRYTTILSEIRGLLAGLIYFSRNRSASSQNNK